RSLKKPVTVAPLPQPASFGQVRPPSVDRPQVKLTGLPFRQTSRASLPPLKLGPSQALTTSPEPQALPRVGLVHVTPPLVVRLRLKLPLTRALLGSVGCIPAAGSPPLPVLCAVPQVMLSSGLKGLAHGLPLGGVVRGGA